MEKPVVCTISNNKASCSKTSPIKRKGKKQKRKSREVSPPQRSKYGCGRLHWNMRNHGTIKRKKRTKVQQNTKEPVETLGDEILVSPAQSMKDIISEELNRLVSDQMLLSSGHNNDQTSTTTQNNELRSSTDAINSSLLDQTIEPEILDTANTSPACESDIEQCLKPAGAAASTLLPPIYPWGREASQHTSLDTAVAQTSESNCETESQTTLHTTLTHVMPVSVIEHTEDEDFRLGSIRTSDAYLLLKASSKTGMLPINPVTGRPRRKCALHAQLRISELMTPRKYKSTARKARSTRKNSTGGK